MPSDFSTKAECRYVSVEQDENNLQNAYVQSEMHKEMSEEESGNINIEHCEMNDMDSAHDISSTTGLDDLDSHIGFWQQAREYQAPNYFRRFLPGMRLTCREIFLSCLLGLAVVIVIVVYLPTEKPGCTTRACVVAASTIANSIDESVDPCDDFYDFACGGWKKKNPLPPGHAYWDTFSNQKLAVEITLKNLLEKTYQNITEGSSVYKAQLFYNTCLNLTAINAYGTEPLKRLIDEVGGWSLDGKWDRSTFQINSLLRRSAQLGSATFFSLVVGTDLKNADSNIILVEEGALNLGKRSRYINKTLDDEVLRAYHEYMTDVAVLLGGERQYSAKAMEDILSLERRLAEIQMPREKARHADLYYRRITISQLQEMSPAIDWMAAIKSSLSSVLVRGTIKSTEKIGTSSVEYLTKVTDVIRSTSNETINNYIMWQMVSLFIPALGQEVLNIRSRLNKKIYGSDSSCIDRWRLCVSAVDMSLGLALGKLFVENHFDQNSKDMAILMVKEIKNAFKRNLPLASWLDKETEERARKKVDAVRDMIGYPDYILNETRINEEYSDLILSKNDSYYDMIYLLLEFSRKQVLRSFREPVDKEKWEMTPPTINAYYAPTENTIVFPAGILQPPAYSSNFPQSVNFGGIGLVVGHELTHGFDDEGRKFGLNGNLDNWWKMDTAEKFKRKAKCIANQYSEYIIDGQHISGNYTLGENIADNGGLRMAYDAYMYWRKTGNSVEDPLLPSLPYTREQLFFIAFAQLWCSKSTPLYTRETTLLNTHSPSKIRVIGTASNSEEFAKAFHCMEGSPMNPPRKCKVW